MQMLRVFFPETSEVERRQLAMAVPMSICPCPGLFDSLELEKLCAMFDTYAPSHVDDKRAVYHKRTWESVRQLVGALGLGDHMEEDRRNAVFDQLDMDGDGLVCLCAHPVCFSLVSWYLIYLLVPLLPYGRRHAWWAWQRPLVHI